MAPGPQSRQGQSPPSSRFATGRQTYLVAYNTICLVLWSTITLRAALLVPVLVAHGKLHALLPALQSLLTWTQTLALLELFHSLLGLVRASPVATAIQVASRVLLVWGILHPFPTVVETTNTFGRAVAGSTTGPIAFSGLIAAWGVTECVRYGFFVAQLGTGRVPPWLSWLRYNTFFVLYPLGISCECLLVWLAVTPASEWKVANGYDVFLKVVLLIYIPGKQWLFQSLLSLIGSADTVQGVTSYTRT